jgi:hypothetical protein
MVTCVVCLFLLHLLYPFSQHWIVSNNHYTVLSIYKKPTLGISLWGFFLHCIHDFMKMSMRSHALHQGSASWLPQVRYCIGVSFSIRIMPAPLSIEESRYGAKKSWLTQFDTTCSVHLGIFKHQAEKWQEIRPTAAMLCQACRGQVSPVNIEIQRAPPVAEDFKCFTSFEDIWISFG